MKKKIVKVALVIAVIFSGFIAAELQGVKVVNEAKADCPVTEVDIHDYLTARGFQIQVIYPINGSTWYACGYEPGGQPPEYWEFTVTVVGCQITGYTRTWCPSCI